MILVYRWDSYSKETDETAIPLDFFLDSIRATSQKNQNDRNRSNGESKLSRISAENNDEELWIVSPRTVPKSHDFHLHGHSHETEEIEFEQADEYLVVLVHCCSGQHHHPEKGHSTHTWIWGWPPRHGRWPICMNLNDGWQTISWVDNTRTRKYLLDPKHQEKPRCSNHAGSDN